MLQPKTPYELSQSQVETPPSVVAFFWRLLKKRRPVLPRVLDMGAGTGVFAREGHFGSYDGVEIDHKPMSLAHLPPRACIYNGCAFKFAGEGYDACIGNPPYVRHHHIESPWKEDVTDALERETGVRLDRHGNLFLYFMTLALAKTSSDGLIAMLVPFEWVSRPSAASLRNHIRKHAFGVSIYRFEEMIFPGVLTTASITIIDKREKRDSWSYFDVSRDLSTIRPRKGANGNEEDTIPHSPRGKVWGRRGLSPGSQQVFVLTEGERVHHGLREKDVIPCVTTLRKIPSTLRELNVGAFQKHFIEAGERCWLIRSSEDSLSPRVERYVETVPREMRDTYTCINQDPWYKYQWMSLPHLLVHSAFTTFGPKVLVNCIRAQAVGSVYGVHAEKRVSLRALQKYLLEFDFEKRVVPHAKTLRKIEVGQLNSVLSGWLENHDDGC